ncbi:hypothetical protein BJ322DRAFT_1220687 [Thelephora terrestris]|uniref:Uncharacterized protein n=1 Tax=Thelephora terrestris TaxID=56493 RepID=A0A9P6H842_9AGAM|nr:hypothetical protein BJ322DRAFT_1220687 [Thelephora terrestris]
MKWRRGGKSGVPRGGRKTGRTRRQRVGVVLILLGGAPRAGLDDYRGFKNWPEGDSTPLSKFHEILRAPGEKDRTELDPRNRRSDERTDHGMQQYSLENVNRRDLVETPEEERIAECGTKLRRGRGGGECVGRGAMADSDRSEVERAVGPRETSGGKFDRRDLFKEIRLKTD